jgi:hypothetical protein
MVFGFWFSLHKTRLFFSFPMTGFLHTQRVVERELGG